MILRLNGTPDTLVAFVACEEITKNDFDKIVLPAANELVQRTGKLNYLLVVADTIKKWSLTLNMNAAMPAFKNWNRAAIVADAETIPWLTQLFQTIVPAESRAFKHNDISNAIKWVGEESRLPG